MNPGINCKKKHVLNKLATVALSLFVFAGANRAQTSAVSWRAYLSDAGKSIRKGQVDKAESSARRALSLIERTTYQPDDMVHCLNVLAKVLTLKDRTVEATLTYERSLHMLEKSHGAGSAKLLPTLVELGSIYESEGDHDAAMHFYNRAIAINEKTYGPFSPGVVYNLGNERHLRRMRRQLIPLPRFYQATQKNILLTDDPALGASGKLELLHKMRNNDLLTGQCNLDEDLQQDFKREFYPAQTKGQGGHGQ